MVKSLFIGGRFNDNCGGFSKIAHQIFKGVELPGMDYHNGGYFMQLELILNKIADYDLVYWFADVPNDKPKLVKQVKRAHKTCTLVTSKRNTENKYSIADLIYHALANKSNLLVEFSESDKRYRGRIIDPLGNIFLDYCPDFSKIGQALKMRTRELLQYTRIPSYRVGEEADVPDEKEFFDIVRLYARRFHELVHAHPEAVNRFFGNASFRCENGFPSFKKEGKIYVSQRNIDKRSINNNSFIAVEQGLPIKYYGAKKPSVDTPVQVMLYDFYKNARYMLHGHVYIEAAPLTDSIIPCGAIEEADEIKRLFPNPEKINFSINLRGHGSLVIADNLDYLKSIQYAPRQIPEVHEYEKN